MGQCDVTATGRKTYLPASWMNTTGNYNHIESCSHLISVVRQLSRLLLQHIQNPRPRNFGLIAYTQLLKGMYWDFVDLSEVLLFRPLTKNEGDGKNLTCRTEKDKHAKLNLETAGTHIVYWLFYTYQVFWLVWDRVGLFSLSTSCSSQNHSLKYMEFYMSFWVGKKMSSPIWVCLLLHITSFHWDLLIQCRIHMLWWWVSSAQVLPKPSEERYHQHN